MSNKEDYDKFNEIRKAMQECEITLMPETDMRERVIVSNGVLTMASLEELAMLSKKLNVDVMITIQSETTNIHIFPSEEPSVKIDTIRHP